jgi:hypothetical protein
MRSSTTTPDRCSVLQSVNPISNGYGFEPGGMAAAAIISINLFAWVCRERVFNTDKVRGEFVQSERSPRRQ